MQMERNSTKFEFGWIENHAVYVLEFFLKQMNINIHNM